MFAVQLVPCLVENAAAGSFLVATAAWPNATMASVQRFARSLAERSVGTATTAVRPLAIQVLHARICLAGARSRFPVIVVNGWRSSCAALSVGRAGPNSMP